MFLRRVVGLLGLAVLLVSAMAAQAKTVTLSSADNRTDVFLNMGDTLVVELSSGDVKGFRWVSHLPKASALTPLGDDASPLKKTGDVPMQTRRFRFNAASVGLMPLVFGFESEVKTPGAAPQDTEAFSVQLHVA